MAFAAIDIVVDGDQIASDCHVCGRLVRPFSWHDDELPAVYVGRFNHHGAAAEVAAWYGSTGSVKSVPAVDEDCPWGHVWPEAFDSSTMARAILAHLVGLDLPQIVWEGFEADVIGPLAEVGGEWVLSVEEITEWLAANR